MARPKIYDDDLRVRLVDIAARVLAEEGPHAVNLRAIAAEAGTSTTAIYSLFGGKADLFRELYLEGFRRLATRLADVPAGGDPLTRISRVGEAYIRSALASPHLYNVMFGPPLAEFCASPEDAVFALGTLQVLIDAVQSAIDAGMLAGDADRIATILWAGNHGVASLGIAGMLGPDAAVFALARATGGTALAGLRQGPTVVS